MKIEITSVTSVSDGAGRRYRHGQVVDVDDELAAAWIQAGHATRATAKPAAGAKVGQGKGGQRRGTRQAPRTTSTAPAGPPSTPPGENARTGTTDE
ncbi:hypothetical protein LUW75_10860 [Streptomyces sp. MRC013]|uniref:hypothetical protein n=1 Tax=Streptomyces sp. MRC013 TaxID=2898276 RepID=UPI002025F4CB|nr:hypothetical protein [Streptomyces sp. MRC013]URM90413.1 hypothetical protein LUW75_10860 [Streptomyces sp. MRC013]